MFDASILFKAFKSTGMLVQATRLAYPGAKPIDAGFVRPDALILGDAVQTSAVELEYVTDSVVPPLAHAEALQIGEQAYRVSGPPRREGDGFFSRARLEATVIS